MSDMNQLKIININMPEYDMLRKTGLGYNIKVTYQWIEKIRMVELYMRDLPFYSFESAAAFQRRVVEAESPTKFKLEVLK